MNEQVLYDKEISVTFYREPRDTEPTYQVSAIQGYREDVIKNKKVLGATAGTRLKTTALGYVYPTTVRLEFYEGSKRRIFAGYKKKRGKEYAVYRTIRATGNLYKFDTIEDMKRGTRPDGSLFRTGDRIRIKENNTIWNVYVATGSPDISIDRNVVETEEELATVLYLNSTNEGLKPDMSLSISLLPGQNCYNAILKVRNLILADRDIRSWTRMVIHAGYRTGPKATYTCPIFASYIEEPNPDGITVFEGLTVGVAEGVLHNRFTEITFVQTKMTLLDLTTQVARGISPNIEVECAIDDEIMNTEITMSKQTVYAQNGIAILNWLQTTISQFIQNISQRNSEDGSHISAFLQLDGTVLQIIALNGPNKMPSRVENIISLDMVSGATFNGTALTVIAPWNPALQPGGLFYMPPEFINGSKLPNVLPADDYRNSENLYRALTMSVAFASAENTNKMEILAVPAQWAGQLPENKSTSMRADLLAQSLSKTIENRITVGNVNSEEVENVNNIKPQEDDTGKKMFDVNRDLIAQWGVWTTLSVDSTKGNCLSQILEYYFFYDPNGPRLAEGKGDATQSSFYKSQDYFKDKGYTKAITYFQNTGCKANILWWPLTVVGTYWRREMDEKSKVSNNWSKIDILNPNKIQEGRALYIPVWAGSWESQLSKLTLIRDIWKWAYIEYGTLYPELRKVWRAMYYYLGGTDELN